MVKRRRLSIVGIPSESTGTSACAVAKKINGGDEDDGDGNFEIREASRIAEITEKALTTRRRMMSRGEGDEGGREVGNGFRNIRG